MYKTEDTELNKKRKSILQVLWKDYRGRVMYFVEE